MLPIEEKLNILGLGPWRETGHAKMLPLLWVSLGRSPGLGLEPDVPLAALAMTPA